MTDNVTLNAGTGGDVVAADDIGGVKYQRVKPAFGVDGSAVDVSATNPLPVAQNDCVVLLNTSYTTAGVSASVDSTGYAAIVVQISGVWNGACTFEASNDGTVWDTILVFSRDNLSLQDVVTSGGLYTIRPSGRYIRLNITSIAGTMAVNAQGRAMEGISAGDLLSLAMDRANNTPMHVQLDDVALSRLPPTNLVKLGEYPIGASNIPIGTILFQGDVSAFKTLLIQTGNNNTAAEQSLDGNTWLRVAAQSGDGMSSVQGANSLGIASHWYVSVTAPFFRLRCVAASATSLRTVVYGSYTAITPVAPYTTVTQLTASLLNCSANANITSIAGIPAGALNPGGGTGNTGSINSLIVATGGASNSPNEVVSAARTTTGNSGTITDGGGSAISAVIAVTAAGGTTPTLDIALQESYDGGTTWTDVYHCERLTGNGTLVVPPIQVYGRRRWAWTITGTSPTFTFPISVSRGGFGSQPVFRQFFDRTAGLLSGTLNATSSTFSISGCSSVSAAITIGAATTGGVYKLQGSADGTNWYDISATVTAVASSTVQISSTAQVIARFCRVLCSTAASSQTGTVVAITASA